MTNKPKRLAISFDGKPYVSYAAPVSVEATDLSCPACGSTAYRHRYTLVQHGFTDDNCLSIVGCDRCGALFHYSYTVESMYAVLFAQPESDPAEPV